MRILLTNDDGINALGLRELAEVLSEFAEVYIAAPAFEQSGTGHGITVHSPIRVNEVIYPVAVSAAWAVQGLPADCVKLALDNLLDSPPDIIVSGINHGANLGTDVIYSGTVSGALEGLINDIPSIAVSVTDGKNNFELAARTAAKLCRAWERANFRPKTMLNVNVPSEVKGMRYAALGDRKYVEAFDERIDPRGGKYFWLHGVVADGIQDADTDVELSKEGYITVTPIQFDLTNRAILDELLNGGGLGSL